ncbi:hypothetical protein JKP88DRAFT_311923 [Tribonema minus]|uniref:Uncharacterized protein n=1 Tax=Tribonema minus TaxID=303371 RepID=A0A835Z133_9STRA|nr:hypothetical protein JKP88DRAFT_311923 [Tribonema minus]
MLLLPRLPLLRSGGLLAWPLGAARYWARPVYPRVIIAQQAPQVEVKDSVYLKSASNAPLLGAPMEDDNFNQPMDDDIYHQPLGGYGDHYAHHGYYDDYHDDLYIAQQHAPEVGGGNGSNAQQVQPPLLSMVELQLIEADRARAAAERRCEQLSAENAALRQQCSTVEQQRAAAAQQATDAAAAAAARITELVQQCATLRQQCSTAAQQVNAAAEVAAAVTAAVVEDLEGAYKKVAKLRAASAPSTHDKDTIAALQKMNQQLQMQQVVSNSVIVAQQNSVAALAVCLQRCGDASCAQPKYRSALPIIVPPIESTKSGCDAAAAEKTSVTAADNKAAAAAAPAIAPPLHDQEAITMKTSGATDVRPETPRDALLRERVSEAVPACEAQGARLSTAAARLSRGASTASTLRQRAAPRVRRVILPSPLYTLSVDADRSSVINSADFSLEQDCEALVHVASPRHGDTGCAAFGGSGGGGGGDACSCGGSGTGGLGRGRKSQRQHRTSSRDEELLNGCRGISAHPAPSP